MDIKSNTKGMHCAEKLNTVRAQERQRHKPLKTRISLLSHVVASTSREPTQKLTHTGGLNKLQQLASECQSQLTRFGISPAWSQV